MGMTPSADAWPGRAVRTAIAPILCAVMIAVSAFVDGAEEPTSKARSSTPQTLKRASPSPKSDYNEQLLLGGRKGTLADLRKHNPPNLAKDAFAKAAVTIDASRLSYKEHFTRRSRALMIKPGTDYTLVCEVKGVGDGYLSVGIRWNVPKAPPGLVDKDEFMTVLKAPEKWTIRSFTFTSDPDKNVTRARILLKAYGGVKGSFRNVRLVQGWYGDLRMRFKRPFKPGARKW